MVMKVVVMGMEKVNSSKYDDEEEKKHEEISHFSLNSYISYVAAGEDRGRALASPCRH